MTAQKHLNYVALSKLGKKNNRVRLISDSSPLIFLLFMGKLLISCRCLSTEAVTLCGNGAMALHLRWLSFTLSTQAVEQALAIARNMRIYFKDQVYDHRVCGKPWTPAAPRAPHRYQWVLIRLLFIPAQHWTHWALALPQSSWKWFSCLLIKLY